jgi:hypothetical protein
LRYTLWGWVAVFDPDDIEVTDPFILPQLAGFVVEEDLYATDYLDDFGQEGALAAALERSGQLRFTFHEGEKRLRVYNEYQSRRPLTDAEIRCLCEYTLGQWSDGMGECIFVRSGPLKDYHLQPLNAEEVGETPYPFVEITDSEPTSHTENDV